MNNKKTPTAKCDTCLYFEYDEWYGDYVCTVNMDMDEIEKLSYSKYKSCPYYRDGDEYKTVRKQN